MSDEKTKCDECQCENPDHFDGCSQSPCAPQCQSDDGECDGCEKFFGPAGKQQAPEESDKESVESEEVNEPEPEPILVGAEIQSRQVLSAKVLCPNCNETLFTDNQDIVAALIRYNAKIDLQCQCGIMLRIHLVPRKRPAVITPEQAMRQMVRRRR